MIKNPDDHLHVYMLNVGQGDTTIIISPKGKIIIIDAMKPKKVRNFLSQLNTDGNIEHLIVTHPHDDHYTACDTLASNYNIYQATFTPFWNEWGMGAPGYRNIIATLYTNGTNINFLSGYSRYYPEEVLIPDQNEEPVIDPAKPFLELLGPTNDMIRKLEEANVLECNHLSIMCRITWKNFQMIITGDAQMENWAFFDHERLLEEKCQVLQAAHHGSKNGTQWERIERLNPSTIIVSSCREGGDSIPDICGSSIFAKFNSENNKFACLTEDTGTIHLKVSSGGNRSLRMMGESREENVNFDNSTPLSENSNPTDWMVLLQKRMENL